VKLDYKPPINNSQRKINSRERVALSRVAEAPRASTPRSRVRHEKIVVRSKPLLKAMLIFSDF
jgi:hypothetical protein